jgi:hypothetical protein
MLDVRLFDFSEGISCVLLKMLLTKDSTQEKLEGYKYTLPLRNLDSSRIPHISLCTHVDARRRPY